MLSDAGDYVFGQGRAEFLENTPATVAQAIQTRLRLATGDWFLDEDEGMPYSTDVFGMGTTNLYDPAFQAVIAGTPGVQSVDDYASFLDTVTRQLTVAALVTTIYGRAAFTVGIQNPFPPAPGRLDIDFILDESELA